MHPDDLIKMAEKYGWRMVRNDETQLLCRFKKGKDDIVDVWWSRMTVGTIITHPKKGRKPLFRRHVDRKLMEKIFQYPRIHTGEGYYTR